MRVRPLLFAPLLATAAALYGGAAFATSSSQLADCGGTCFPCGYFSTELQIHPGLWWPYAYECTNAPCPNMCQTLPGNGGDEAPNPLTNEEVVDAFTAAVDGSDASALSALLGSGRVQRVPERDALQVVGCGDMVIATVDIPQSLSADLEQLR